MAKGKKFRIKPQIPEEFYTVQEVAELLRVEKHAIYRYIKDYGLPHVQIGRRFLINKVAFRAWISENGAGDFNPYENS